MIVSSAIARRTNHMAVTTYVLRYNHDQSFSYTYTISINDVQDL